jgi:glycine/D-amino acid oxidase-like deaminating enzyme
MSTTGGGSAGSAVVIGGGFYGSVIAAYLKQHRKINRVILVEREHDLLRRASYNNQARVHNGYHYPRSFTTAFRSRVNLPRFLQDWPEAVKRDFTKLYAIPHSNSKVTGKQFLRFCMAIGAKATPAPQPLKQIFEPRLIQEVFLTEEYAFDATRLAASVMRKLCESRVDVMLDTCAVSVLRAAAGSLHVILEQKDGSQTGIDCQYVFNCTYSGLNQLRGDYPGTRTNLKHEITEMALMLVPSVLRDFGITVMDGPFFSLMPFPARNLHTLSHVRYTPHLSWKDDPTVDPHQRLAAYNGITRVHRMVRDVTRYIPRMLEATYVESLYEVKTVLEKNEIDDGRPILLEKHSNLPGCYSVLGGKIDNIYDVLERLEAENIGEPR